jgi:WhiB family redox-sensing transcriptional regulator
MAYRPGTLAHGSAGRPAPFLPDSRRPANDWSWQLLAACSRTDGSIFYAPDRERGAAVRRREGRAKEICQQCPVLEPCLQLALENRETHGVWGGLNTAERQRLLKRRSAG